MGKLIIIEGGDGSGKATQTDLLKTRLEKEGYMVRSVSFPDYDSDGSALVKMYLAGNFGKSPNDVNPFISSTFYAVDRFASYRMKWQQFYESGGIIIADRYTTSNMVHQMVKYEDMGERKAFLCWLEDLEFERFELPRPDVVCLLDVEQAVTEKLMLERMGKTGGQTGDIHENNRVYLASCHAAYDELVAMYDWRRIQCSRNGEMRAVEDIHQDVYDEIIGIL